MIGPLSYLDAALLALAFISGLLAMYRGITREILSILSWAVAAGAVLFFVLKQKPLAEDVAKQFQVQVPIAQIAIGAIIFLIVLIVVHLITSRISDTILDSRVGLIDRVLGFLFGVARGFILIVIPYMFYESFIPEPANHFPWITQSRSLPYIKSTGNALRGMLERYVPSNLTVPTPPQGEQQGFIVPDALRQLAQTQSLPYHISVTLQSVGRPLA